MQFLQFSPKRSFTWFSLLPRTISPLGLVHFISILEILTICISFNLRLTSIVLHNNIWKNTNQAGYIWNVFPRLWAQFFNTKNFQFKIHIAKNFHKWRAKSFESVGKCSNKLFFLTLNANIFQSVQSNFMKFLPHDLKQIKYMIWWVFFLKIVLFSWMNATKMAMLSGV